MGMFSSRDIASHFRPAPKRRAARGTGERSRRKAAKLAFEREAMQRTAITADFTVHIATPNPLNGSHCHWRTKAEMRKKQRVAMAERLQLVLPVRLPCVVEMTRCGLRVLDDDNLRAAIKVPRDSIAAWLGVDDRNPLVKWEYAQRREPVNCVAVVVRAANQGSDQR